MKVFGFYFRMGVIFMKNTKVENYPKRKFPRLQYIHIKWQDTYNALEEFSTMWRANKLTEN